MKRIIFLIDGFNLYGSVRDIKKDFGDKVKWLDIASLCKSYLHYFGKDAQLDDIYYFSAVPNYLQARDPNRIKRHKDYMSCLESTGIHVELGRFKEKERKCNYCKKIITMHEEKETDVRIAVKVFEIFHLDIGDIIIIVSGDTDLSPAIEKSKTLFPNKLVLFAFPYNRRNTELAALATRSFRIKREHYQKHQLPDPIILQNKHRISKPKSW
jgi:uncharacterized LabA/DUF88 family protein